MTKSLDDLTKEEWDTLFPIELVAHDLNWKNVYQQEQQQIMEKIGAQVIRMEHVGSTSIPNIKSKPYIDISIEIQAGDLFDTSIIEAMQRLGYHFFRQSGDGTDYMIFVKGYQLGGPNAQIFHVHMCPSGHKMLDQVRFKEYLISNPKSALEYEQLKLELATQYKNDRVGYRLAKGDFVKKVMSEASKSIG